jgi:hypothetical protein
MGASQPAPGQRGMVEFLGVSLGSEGRLLWEGIGRRFGPGKLEVEPRIWQCFTTQVSREMAGIFGAGYFNHALQRISP